MLGRNPDHSGAAERMQKNAHVVVAVGVRHEEAVARYRRALAIKPDHADAHDNLGLSFVRQARCAVHLAATCSAVVSTI
jgi:Tfp pilus assembly protein PilF